jgi:hypothetical protein
LYRKEHDPCGKRAKGTVLIRETHPPKTKNQDLTQGRRRRRRRGNTWRTEKCAENETGLKEAIAMASKTVALLFCRPLFSLSLSLSLSLDTHPQTTPNLSLLRGRSETGLGRIRVRGRGEGDDVRVSRRVWCLIRLRNNLTVGYVVCHPDL